MNIGGIDIIIRVPSGVPVAEIVLDRVRRLWPGSRFVDAEETESHPIEDPWVLNHGGQSDEFLIYQDADALESWRREGLTPSNANTMLHFLVEDLEDGSRELTLVCDSRTEEIEQLVRELKLSFEGQGSPRRSSVDGRASSALRVPSARDPL